MILIKNFVNKALDSMNTVDEVDHYFLSPSSNQDKVFFVALKPNNDINLSEMPCENAIRYLTSLRDRGEFNYFQKKIRSIENKDHGKKVSNEVKNLKTFGVKNVGLYLQVLSMSLFTARFPVIKDQVKEEISNLEEERDILLKEIESFNAEKAKGLYWKFVRIYVKNLKALIGFETAYDRNNLSLKLVDPSQFKKLFQEEYETAHRGQKYYGKQIPTYEDLVAQLNNIPALGSTDIHYQVKSHLYGNASKDRLINVMKHLIKETKLNKFNLEDMFNCVNAENCGVIGINSKKALHSLLEANVRDLDFIVDWIVNHVEMLLKQHNSDTIKTVINDPSNSYQTFRSHHSRFIQMFTNYFEEEIKRQSGEIRSAITRLIFDHAVTIDLKEPFYYFSVIANQMIPSKLLLSHQNNDNPESEKGFFNEYLNKSIVGSKALQGKEFVNAISPLQSVKEKIPAGNPVQLAPLIDGDIDTFNETQIIETAEVQFNFIKFTIANRMAKTIQSQYQYLINTTLDQFNEDITHRISNWSNEYIQNDLIGGDQLTIQNLKVSAEEVGGKINTLKRLQSLIGDIQRQLPNFFSSNNHHNQKNSQSTFEDRTQISAESSIVVEENEENEENDENEGNEGNNNNDNDNINESDEEMPTLDEA